MRLLLPLWVSGEGICAIRIKIALDYEIARVNNDPRAAAANSGTDPRVQEYTGYKAQRGTRRLTLSNFGKES